MFGPLSRSPYLPGYVWSPPSGTSAGCRRYLHLKTLFAFFISSTSSMDWSGVALESDEGAVGPLPTTLSYLCVCVRLLGYSTHKKMLWGQALNEGFMAADWKVIETTSWFRGLDNQARNTHSAHLLCYIEDLYSTTRFFASVDFGWQQKRKFFVSVDFGRQQKDNFGVLAASTRRAGTGDNFVMYSVVCGFSKWVNKKITKR